MKIKSKNKKISKKIIIIPIVVLLIAFIALEKLNVINLIHIHNQNNVTNEKNSTKIDENQATDDQINNGNNTKSNSSSDKPNQPTSIDGSNKKSVQVTITSYNQGTNSLDIRAIIGTVTSSGSCKLSLTKNSLTIARSVNVQAQATISACESFSIPLSEIGTGQWKATVSFENDTLLGSSSVDIMIK